MHKSAKRKKRNNAARVALLIGCVTLVGCATRAEVRTEYVDNFCILAAPIYVSSQDEFTDGTAEQILVHNALGERRCGW